MNEQLLDALNGLAGRSAFGDDVGRLFADQGIFLLALGLVACGVVQLVADRRTGVRVAVVAAAAVGLTFLGLLLAGTLVVERRPFIADHDTLQLIGHAADNSFPSDHAAIAAAAATVAALAWRWLAAPLVLLAALIGLARVFVGVHYPGDVLAGWAIGVPPRWRPRPVGGPPAGRSLFDVDGGAGLGELRLDASSASSLLMPSLTFVGAASTRSLASFRPRPLTTSRMALMTLILLSPKLLRTTLNSVFSSSTAAAAAAPPPPGAGGHHHRRGGGDAELFFDRLVQVAKFEEGHALDDFECVFNLAMVCLLVWRTSLALRVRMASGGFRRLPSSCLARDSTSPAKLRMVALRVGPAKL